MRRGPSIRYIVLLLAVLSACKVQAATQDRVTVAQLEQRIAGYQGLSDRDVAHHLQNLELTQRLSASRLLKLETALPGRESRDQLLAVADLSEFLALPPAEIPLDPPPTLEDQEKILSRLLGVSFASAARSMPDFDTTAKITRFRNAKFIGAEAGDPYCRLCIQPIEMQQTNPMAVLVNVPLPLTHGTDHVAVRAGRLITTHTEQAWAPDGAVLSGAESWEGLYSVLSSLLGDLRTTHSTTDPPKWARWERGQTGNLAVFTFSVAERDSHFAVRSIRDTKKWYLRDRPFSGSPAYRAEVAVDPATGAVHRFVISAILPPHSQVSRADVAVEFAHQTVGGQTFLAPLRAVTLGVSTTYLIGGSQHGDADIRKVMHLLDVEFTDYRPGLANAAASGGTQVLAAVRQMERDQVTVDQLERIIAAFRGRSDSEAGQRLGQLVLTQRLTADRYERMRSMLPGNASAQALRALYDLSSFAALPRDDVASGSTPDPQLEGRILRSAVSFVAETMHKMPDLFAARDLTRLEDLQVVRGAMQTASVETRPFAVVDTSTGTVHFRQGREVLETSSERAPSNSSEMGLDTWGAFGPVLEMVMIDVLDAKIGWSHWEHGPSGTLAVFRYAVPRSKSHYHVRFCCYLTDDGSPSSFAAVPGYHGELTIDPISGAVLRITLQADFNTAAAQLNRIHNPVLRSDMLIEYGAVDIAGKKFICPVRAISVMSTWTLGPQGPVDQAMSKSDGAKAAKNALAAMEFSRVTAINESAFRQYHLFGSEMRMIGEPASTPPNP